MTYHLSKTLKDTFGFDQFRPGQEEVIRSLLDHNKVLCIQPTGYGKSLLYQLPAVILGGVTVVISPLLALMRDQIQQLQYRFNISAASINSDQTPEENDRALQETKLGKIQILFLAPERLDRLEIQQFLAELPIELLVVDEAHCISTWGHDFRPAYRQITETIRQLEKRKTLKILGLTATANQKTERDIAAQLGGETAIRVIRSHMDRPNLALAVRKVEDLGQKLALLQEILGQEKGCSLIYCATREHTEIVASFLGQCGIPAAAYHAGLDPDLKLALQQRFVKTDSGCIAATNALGMGIDKPNIRLIIHLDVPGSITAYYQEVGRAGRDGEPAKGLLLYDPADRRIQEYFIQSAQPGPSDFKAILNALDPAREMPGLNDLKIRTGLHPTRVNVVLAELIEQGFVAKHLDGRKQVYRKAAKTGEPDLTRYQRQEEVRNFELKQMVAYAEKGDHCLMTNLRQTLGDAKAKSCGRCGFCHPESFLKWQQEVDSRAAWEWLTTRPIPIPSSKVPKMEEGISILAAEMNAPMFRKFMRERADESVKNLHPELAEWLQARVKALAWEHQFGAVITLPSRTWTQRESVAMEIARVLDAENWEDRLYWRHVPEHRQGQLLNNDQRRKNVAKKMTFHGYPQLPKNKAILLVDDYLGSGVTLKEAVRCIRQAGFKGKVVPFAIASVRWRLGAKGMV